MHPDISKSNIRFKYSRSWPYINNFQCLNIHWKTAFRLQIAITVWRNSSFSLPSINTKTLLMGQWPSPQQRKYPCRQIKSFLILIISRSSWHRTGETATCCCVWTLAVSHLQDQGISIHCDPQHRHSSPQSSDNDTCLCTKERVNSQRDVQVGKLPHICIISCPNRCFIAVTLPEFMIPLAPKCLCPSLIKPWAPPAVFELTVLTSSEAHGDFQNLKPK